MQEYLDMQRIILERVSYKKDLICRDGTDWDRVWAYMGERIYSVFEYFKFNKNAFPENVSEEYGILYEHDGNAKKMIHRCQIGERHVYCLPWRVKPSLRYKELAEIYGLVFVHTLGENVGNEMNNVIDVSLYAEAIGADKSKLYIMLDKENETIIAHDLYDSKKIYSGKTIELSVEINSLTTGVIPIGFDFDKKEFYSTDIDGNVEEGMRSITLMNWEGYYDTYFVGSYIFEMPIW